MKKMHGRALPALAAGLIVGLLICAGCIFGSPQQTPPVNNTPVNDTGIVPIVMGSGSLNGGYSLEDAEAAVANQIRVNESIHNISVYLILGTNVDTAGRAKCWIFGVREGKSITLWAYDRSGLAPIAWSGDLPNQMIDTASILPPEKAIAIIYTNDRNTTGYYNVEISNGDYKINEVSGASSPEHMINATTGVLISTHD